MHKFLKIKRIRGFLRFKGIQLKDIWVEMLGGRVEGDGLDWTSKKKFHNVITGHDGPPKMKF